MTLALIGLLAAVNPAAAAATIARDRRTDRPVPVGIGVAAAVVALAVLAAVSDTVLEALDVNLGTYRLGAGVVLVFAGIRWLVTGTGAPATEPETDLGLAAFVTFPTLVTPGAAALAISIGAEHGVGRVAVGAAVAAVLGGLGVFRRRTLPPAMIAGAVRFLGGVTAVIGVILAVDGVKTL